MVAYETHLSNFLPYVLKGRSNLNYLSGIERRKEKLFSNYFLKSAFLELLNQQLCCCVKNTQITYYTQKIQLIGFIGIFIEKGNFRQHYSLT